MRALVIAGVLSLVPGVATAACSERDIDGLWLVASSAPAVCTLEGNAAGAIVRGVCRYRSYTGPGTLLSGRFEVSSSCAVIGTVVERLGSRTVQGAFVGRISKGPEVIMRGWITSSEARNKVTAIRQW